MNAPFAEVSPLVESGRFAEALRALRRVARRGGAEWEALIWLGRIEERRGRAKAAERAFRRALAASPDAPQVRVELARFLESAGRGDEARALVREGAAAADGRSPLLGFDLSRRLLWEGAAAAPEDIARLEAETRAGLAAHGAPAAELLPELIDRGRYGPALERAYLARLRASAAGDKLAREAPQAFSALMCAGRYAAAFRLGEALLDLPGRAVSPTQFLWPWWRRVRRAVAEDAFIKEELARVRRAARRGGHPLWFAYYRAVLLANCGRSREAMDEYALIRDRGGKRHAWMFQSFVLAKLSLLDFPGAVKVCRAFLDRAGSHWWVRCRMAEAHLAAGDAAEAFREFAKAEESADPAERREALTWHGEALLWTGAYERALAKFDAAVALGASDFVYGWRGAARWKLGDRRRALGDLDRAVALDPKDFEARAWRGEFLRVLGRREESRRDLDLVVASAPDDFWARLNRALQRGASGDAAGMTQDFAALPRRVTGFVAAGLGLPEGAPLDAERMRAVGEAALERAMGVRRWETYVQSVWMGAGA